MTITRSYSKQYYLNLRGLLINKIVKFIKGYIELVSHLKPYNIEVYYAYRKND